MVVPLQAHETLSLSIKVVETRVLPSSLPSKWRGLRGLEVPLDALAGVGRFEGHLQRHGLPGPDDTLRGAQAEVRGYAADPLEPRRPIAIVGHDLAP